VVKLPWSSRLKLCNETIPGDCIGTMSHAARVAKGAYHLRSTQPVTVYQFNSLEYVMGVDASYSNDASLLLPVNAWGREYVAAAWPQFDVSPLDQATWPGLVAVTAVRDDTTVTITTRATTDASADVPAFATGVPAQVTLAAGEVIEIAAFGQVGSAPLADLTGSIIQADKPVQVISGHFCAQVPVGVVACDHLEESMFPVETLSTTYLVTSPAVPPLPDGKEEVVRVVATQPGTTLTFDPPQVGVPTTLAQAGDFVEIARQVADFEVTADQKVMVVQYMEGEEAGGDISNTEASLSEPMRFDRPDGAYSVLERSIRAALAEPPAPPPADAMPCRF
jgi:hypothetical protein